MFRLLILAVAVAIAVGVSWALASNAVSDVLGEPPPQMGRSHVTLQWRGAPGLKDHARAWLFAYQGTRVPGAPNVRIHVSPMGKLLKVEPADLASRLKSMRRDF
jgi:hypothetical protein